MAEAELRQRNNKRPRSTSSMCGPTAMGYYADPMSPIASTPMKRQRSKPENTKSAKPKHAAATPASCLHDTHTTEEEEQFFSPRKLVNEYNSDEDDEEEKDTNEKTEEPTKENQEDPTSESPIDAMFSPTLKVPPHHPHSHSASSSPSSVQSRLELRFLSTSSIGSSSEVDEEVEQVTEAESTAYATQEEEQESIETEEQADDEEQSMIRSFDPFYFMKMLPKYDEYVPGVRPVVLPEKSRHAPRICLVLDLDETLVHCSVEEIENPHLQFPVNFNGTDYMVNVKKRPHMEYFLRRVSKLFEVVVFTASHRVYAEKLLNLLDPRRELIKYRIYRDDCLHVEGNYLKDLNVLGRHLSQVLLVDNSPHAFGYQVNNGIPIETWYDDEDDCELLNLLPFLESLVDADDVRPIIEKQFQIQKLIDAAE